MEVERFSNYEEYVRVQSEANKRKLEKTWVKPSEVRFLSDYLTRHLGRVSFGICHGVRNGAEVKLFGQALPGAEIVGTEISDTAEQFSGVVRMDFHDVPQAWINRADFIYSNSFDHSYDPRYCLSQWMRCLKPEGILLIQWSNAHEHRHLKKAPANGATADCFKATQDECANLIRERFVIKDVLRIPTWPWQRLGSQKKAFGFGPGTVWFAVGHRSSSDQTTAKGSGKCFSRFDHAPANAIDPDFRALRMWSNSELRKFAPLFGGSVLNASAWKDVDKEGSRYRDYFTKAKEYMISNYHAEAKGMQHWPDEFFLDLEGEVPGRWSNHFDVVFNHTTLEHVYDFKKAFANLCKLSKDAVIVVLPARQPLHGVGYSDYWRFTPEGVKRLYEENGLSLRYVSSSGWNEPSVYLFCIGYRRKDWDAVIPEHYDSGRTAPSKEAS